MERSRIPYHDRPYKDADGLGEADSVIGSASVLDFDLPKGSQDADFCAVAYDTEYGTVISYRGIDNPVLGFSYDIYQGYGISVGLPSAISVGGEILVSNLIMSLNFINQLLS